ncbi:hypothetical protein [Catenulispora subtropica]|uniref:Glycosyltransferase RgtA/B/C/D-like domain-containing protein n=1 Tax=Catenulispora subtropica TaxID=450798 RepID=A0ABP5EKP2_9ACTN
MRSQRLLVVIAGIVGLIGVLMLWAGPTQGVGRAETDTVHYAQRAYEFAGYDDKTATDKAVDFVCDDEVDYTDIKRGDCVWNTTGVLSFPKPYQEIFRARPGFPALMSLFIRVFGDQGIYLTVLFLQIATGVLLVLAARAVGLPGLWPLAAEVAYFVLPSGFVGTRVLSEAASSVGLVALLYAAALIVQDRRRTMAVSVAAAAFAWLFAVRAADAAMAASFLLAVGVGALALRKPRRPWAVRLAVLSGASLAVMVAISAALAWPTINQGITDTMTDHFTQPVKPDMYIRFLHAEFRFWRAFLPLIAGGAYLVVLAALGLWGVARWVRGWAAAVFLGVAAVGPASLLLHPGDWARMLVPMWIVVSLGLPLLVAPLMPRRETPVPESGDAEENDSPLVPAAVLES